MKTPMRAMLCAAGLLAWLGAAAADQPWRGKPAEQWSQEEALEVLNNSPWARTVELYQPSGRRLGVYPNGRKVVVQDTPTGPSRIYEPSPPFTEPELLRAVYAVRWSSAKIIQAALRRLKEHSATMAEMQAEAEDLSPQHYVLTVRVVEPPAQSSLELLERPVILGERGTPLPAEPPLVGRDLFAGLSEEELRARAELRLAGGGQLKAERAQRHGLGASEGISFFFPRTAGGRPVVSAKTSWAEFQFRSPDRITLKARFKTGEMKAGGRPDFRAAPTDCPGALRPLYCAVPCALIVSCRRGRAQDPPLHRTFHSWRAVSSPNSGNPGGGGWRSSMRSGFWRWWRTPSGESARCLRRRCASGWKKAPSFG